jgi:peptide/nickel transport system ATP-binding protein
MPMPLLQITDLVTEFVSPETGRVNRACDGVSISVDEAEIVGLVGESGCGKSTLGRTIVGLETLKSGRIAFDGAVLSDQKPAVQRQSRRRMQYIFQDSLAALEPRQNIGAALHEALVITGERNLRARHARIAEILAATNLPESILSRYPRELSGGQRQRVCIARALLANPRLLICDEPVSSLDMSLRAQVMNQFLHLRDRFGVAIILIAHDLAVVRQACARVNVMYLGKIVESGPSAALYDGPRHPYSKALISAVLGTDPVAERQRQRVPLVGDLPSPYAAVPGCKFASRCPNVMDICRRVAPLPVADGARVVSCHLLGEPIRA